ncbi:GNAT family N-acetyltransferase [Xylanimonas sp. McL0601]|uniref:GNAT family N-acetyltransferase n=1 Tax=Xylanimonas sp. McL0601 TaxID=3414739 RepID=UPI003CEB91FE
MGVRDQVTAGAGRDIARVLAPADLPEALAVCALDPVAAVLASSRIEIAVRAGLPAAGGQVWGWPAAGRLRAVCWSGANLVPVVPAALGADGVDAIGAFVRIARGQGRRSSSIVGESGAALALWAGLERFWPPAREVRAHQPSLAIARDPDVEPDPRVRLSRLEELPTLMPACVAMFTEEVGYSPVAGGGVAYRERVRSLVADSRSYVRFAARFGDPYARPPGPAVEFKAELGAVAQGVAQVQGVWVDPALRGRRLSEGGMAAVVADARRRLAPVVSLYVNGYNVRAMRAYRRVGFDQVGTFATVLF